MNRGFTLLELMLTILILAIIMALVYGIVVTTVQAANRIEEVMQGVEIGPAILAQLRDDLEGVILTDPKGDQFNGLDRKLSFGDRDRIDFLTTTMAYDREKDDVDPRFHGLNEVGYTVLDHPNDPNVGILYRRIDPFVDADPLKGGRLVELYDRVRSFNVTYVEDPAKPPSSSWNSKEKQGKLPKAFRVELVILVGQGEERRYTITITRVE
jgi:prepilin-type N-terminal cleavage/methylation domain-containing protein